MKTDHKITIKIDTSNAAFEDHEGAEVAKQLRRIARTLADNGPELFAHDEPRAILDTNGNTCGTVHVEASSS